MSLKTPLNVLGKNSEIYKSFSVTIKKEVIKIDKDDNKIVETISYKIKFIDSMRFTAIPLTKPVENIS